jgi:O-antigen ligase
MARTRTRRRRSARSTRPKQSPVAVALLILLAEFILFSVSASDLSILIRSFAIGLPLIYFVAKRPVIGIYALAFLIPLEVIARIPNEFFSVYKLLGLFTLTSTVVHAALGPKPPPTLRSAMSAWVLAFIFFVGCTFLWSLEPPLTLQAFRRLGTLAVFFFLVARLVNTTGKLRTLLTVMVAAAVVAALLALISYGRGEAVFDTQSTVQVDGKLRVSGANLDANFFAATVLAALPICLLVIRHEREVVYRFGYALAGALIMLGVIFSFSRGGAVTMGLILVLAFASVVRKLRGAVLLSTIGGSVAVLLIAAAALPSSYTERISTLRSPLAGDESLRGRALYVEFGRESIQAAPMGVGAGSFPVAFRQSRFNQFYRYYDLEHGEGRQGRSAHNMFLEVAVENGFVGGLLFVGLIGFALYEGLRTRKQLIEHPGERSPYLRSANAAVWIALVAFSFAGLFLSAQYDKTLWLLLALIPVLRNLAYRAGWDDDDRDGTEVIESAPDAAKAVPT